MLGQSCRPLVLQMAELLVSALLQEDHECHLPMLADSSKNGKKVATAHLTMKVSRYAICICASACLPDQLPTLLARWRPDEWSAASDHMGKRLCL